MALRENLLALKNETPGNIYVSDAPVVEPVLEQQRVNDQIADYMQSDDVVKMRSRQLVIEVRSVRTALDGFFPHIEGKEEGREQTLVWFEHIVNTLPIQQPSPMMVLVIRAGLRPMEYIHVPNATQAYLVASANANDGVVRSYFIQASDMKPDLQGLDIKKGFGIILQPLDAVMNQFGDNMPKGIGGGGGPWLTARNKDGDPYQAYKNELRGKDGEEDRPFAKLSPHEESLFKQGGGRAAESSAEDEASEDEPAAIGSGAAAIGGVAAVAASAASIKGLSSAAPSLAGASAPSERRTNNAERIAVNERRVAAAKPLADTVVQENAGAIETSADLDEGASLTAVDLGSAGAELANPTNVQSEIAETQETGFAAAAELATGAEAAADSSTASNEGGSAETELSNPNEASSEAVQQQREAATEAVTQRAEAGDKADAAYATALTEAGAEAVGGEGGGDADTGADVAEAVVAGEAANQDDGNASGPEALERIHEISEAADSIREVEEGEALKVEAIEAEAAETETAVVEDREVLAATATEDVEAEKAKQAETVSAEGDAPIAKEREAKHMAADSSDTTNGGMRHSMAGEAHEAAFQDFADGFAASEAFTANGRSAAASAASASAKATAAGYAKPGASKPFDMADVAGTSSVAAGMSGLRDGTINMPLSTTATVGAEPVDIVIDSAALHAADAVTSGAGQDFSTMPFGLSGHFGSQMAAGTKGQPFNSLKPTVITAGSTNAAAKLAKTMRSKNTAQKKPSQIARQDKMAQVKNASAVPKQTRKRTMTKKPLAAKQPLVKRKPIVPDELAAEQPVTKVSTTTGGTFVKPILPETELAPPTPGENVTLELN